MRKLNLAASFVALLCAFVASNMGYGLVGQLAAASIAGLPLMFASFHAINSAKFEKILTEHVAEPGVLMLYGLAIVAGFLAAAYFASGRAGEFWFADLYALLVAIIAPLGFHAAAQVASQHGTAGYRQHLFEGLPVVGLASYLRPARA